MATDVHQRTSYSTNMDEGAEEDDGDEYYAPEEDNGEVKRRETKPQVDPGPFKYNQKVCVAAIPCLLLVLAVTGEMLLVIASFGFALLLSIDSGGHNQRTAVIFMTLFVPCHILILYSVVPLLWVSLLSIILLGLLNVFVLMTGAWIIIQFTVFRKQEVDMCIMTEKLLFSAYPGVSACLLSWAAATFIPLKFIPFVLTTIGFVFLQVFMTPTASSFRLHLNKDKDNNIVDNKMLATIATAYCLLPTVVQIVIGIYQHSMAGVLHLGFVVDTVFLVFAAIFLTTLMSLRSVIETIGWNYSLVARVRWISGAIVTILCYPVLLNLGISSHFLPWLPAAIALYSSFGALLSYKKYKVASLACFGVTVLFSMVWPLKLPWKLDYTFMFGLSLTSIYALLLVNSFLCLCSVYMATHGRQEIFSTQVLIQTIVFIKCELVLHDSELYGWPLFIVTSTAAVYAIQRLLLARKLPPGLSCFCMSLHITKVLAVSIYPAFKADINSLISCVTLFFLVFMVTKTLLNEMKQDATTKEIGVTLGMLCLSVVVNINPLLFILGTYLFQVQASAADATGICCIICGILVIAICSLHMTSEVRFRQLGIMSIGIGLLIIILQPGTELTGYCVFQWTEVLSVILTVFVITSDVIKAIPQIAVTAVFMGICPGVRGVFMFYPPEDIPAVSATLFVVTSVVIMCAVICFFKAQLLGHAFERHIIRLCVVLVVTSQITLITDLMTKQRYEPILSVPAWKLFLLANLVISICLKVLSAQQYAEIIPLTDRDDDKNKSSMLPLAGNVATVMTFLLTCLLAPASGFLHDIWCCGASLILICLQKDGIFIQNMTESNQTVPTKMTAIFVLLMMTFYRNAIWDARYWTFVRCLIEISMVIGSLPVYYILWLVTWKKDIEFEKVVVFVAPLNLPIYLYGSSYTSWALATAGVSSSLWMMSNVFPLKPYEPMKFVYR